MIKEVKMWSAICDECSKKFEIGDGITAMNDKEYMLDFVWDSDWALVGEQTYCSDCYIDNGDGRVLIGKHGRTEGSKRN